MFLDETSANTSMVRRYGRTPRGERCWIAEPFGHGKTTTVTAALRNSGLNATALLDGATNGERFRAYVVETLVPALRQGDTVILDNLPAHTLDPSNRRFARGAVDLGAAGFAPKRSWSTKFEMRSPRYTTRLDDLPVVAAA